MKPLRDAVAEYIALRRRLGYKLRDMATGLTDFAGFLEQHAAPFITSALAVAWAMQAVDHQPSDWAQRLGFVRVFAHHWSATDPRTEIPPAGLLPFRPRRARPYLYTTRKFANYWRRQRRCRPPTAFAHAQTTVSAGGWW